MEVLAEVAPRRFSIRARVRGGSTRTGIPRAEAVRGVAAN